MISPQDRRILRQFREDQDWRIATGEHLRTFREYLEDMRWQKILIAYQAQKYGSSKRVRATR